MKRIFCHSAILISLLALFASEGTSRLYASELSADIHIQTRSIQRSVSREILGANLEWFRNACGLWHPELPGIRPEILTAYKALGLSVIRFPGGTLADYYHWRDGIGPVSTRQIRKHGMDEGQSRSTFGTDEFLQFCEQTGAQPLLSVNVATGTAQEAAQWVAYCNTVDNKERIANGRQRPYSVRYWEIGNEPYLKSDNKLTAASFMSAHEYAKRFLSFARAMKAVDPTIKLLAVGGSNFGRYNFVADSHWNQKILPLVASHADMLSIHNGYFPLIIEPGFQSFDDVYRAMLAAPIWIDNNLKTTEKQIAKCTPANAAKLRIAVTEWAPLFHVSPDNRWVDHSKTLGSGLYTASVILTFLRSNSVDLSTTMKLMDETFLGLLSYDGVPKPTYYALQMLSQHLRGEVVTTSVTSPTFNSPGIGVVEHLSDVPYLDAAAVLSPSGDQLTLFVVNKHFTEPIRTRVSLENFLADAKADVTTLTGKSLDCNNGPDILPIPGLKWCKQTCAPVDPQFYQGKPGTVIPVNSTVRLTQPSSLLYDIPPRSFTVLVLHSRVATAKPVFGRTSKKE